MQIKNIVIVTDCSDIALEQVKAKLVSYLPNDKINFFSLIVPPFQIHNGTFISQLISEYIPHGKNTMFLAIVNPLQSKPKRIFGKLKNGTWFTTADTGIFSLLFKDVGIQEVYEGNNQKHYPFGGLHVHTSTAGSLLSGIPVEELGNRVSETNILHSSFSHGEVVHVDNFGLIKTWIRTKDFDFIDGDEIEIIIAGSSQKISAKFSNRMMDLPDNTVVVYPGSSLLDSSKIDDMEEYRKSGLIEIGLVRNPNSAKELGIKIGDIITISKKLQLNYGKQNMSSDLCGLRKSR